MADSFVVVEKEQLGTSTEEIYAAGTSPNTKALVTFCVATNASSSNVTITVTVTPSGGAAATYISARTIPAGKSDLMPEILGMGLDPGDALNALASSGSAVNMKLRILEST